MSVWVNGEGIDVRFGTSAAVASKGGAPVNSGETNTVVFDLDLTELATGSDLVIDDEMQTLPKGALITEAFIDVLTAATSGGSATLDVGIYGVDDGAAIDDNGIDAAVALAAITPAGARIVCDGAIVGTALAEHSFIGAGAGTAVFTAGKVRVTIKYQPRLNREAQ